MLGGGKGDGNVVAAMAGNAKLALLQEELHVVEIKRPHQCAIHQHGVENATISPSRL